MDLAVIATLVACLSLAVLFFMLLSFKKARRAINGEVLARREDNLRHVQQLQELHKQHGQEISALETKVATLTTAYLPVIDIDAAVLERKSELNRMQAELQALNAKYTQGLQYHSSLEKQISLYEDSLDITEFGLYKPVFSFDTSEEYKQKLTSNYEEQKDIIKGGKAVICHTEWEISGSKTEGKKMTDKYKKLMLFAFNGECDAIMAKVKWNNASKMQDRIYKSFENVNKLGATTRMEITLEFLDLKLAELALTHEMEQKVYEEKEEQRAIREQMREEEKAQKELERAQREAEEEERRYQKAIERVKKEMGHATQAEIDALNQEMNFLQQQLQEAHEKRERAISMAQLTKVGHIYVISNLGSFGENVYKIGMTRRLDPADRIRELGDASVPFGFDVHAIIYSENAPQLERELHVKFADRRLNRVNLRKEFFNVSLEEIEAFVHQHAGAEISFTKLAEAREYRETVSLMHRLMPTKNENQKTELLPQSLL